MTATGDRRGPRAIGGTVTVLALTVIESPVARRVTRTRIGREIRATRSADRAVRALKRRRMMETITREVGVHPRATGGRVNGAASIADGRPRKPSREMTITPFVILCQARTGSNLVQSELCRRWPEIRCLGEEYGPRLRLLRPPATTEEITERVFAATDEHPIVGCRLFYLHVNGAEFRDILTVPGMKVVHLQRRNILRRYVSLQIAMNNQIWARGRRAAAPAIDERAVTIDIDEFIDTSILAAERQASMERVLQHACVDVLDVWYEDVSAHLDAQLRRIAAFLGLGEPVFESEPVLTRQNPEPLRLLVRNYAEVRRRLSLSSMRVFLDPEDAGRPYWRVRLRRQSRTCWPTEQQELLLQAALLPPGEAGAAFVQWRNMSNPYDIDDGSRRLYPMVHRNLRRAGVETSLDNLVWDAYVQASVRNQKLLHTLERVLADLHDAGVPTMVLKGAALMVLHYRDRGTRPMADLDVLVPRELVGRTLEVLRADGWDMALPGSDESIDQLLRMRHSVPLRRGDEELDLHWYALVACIDTELEAELWDSSVEMDVGRQRTRALAPADQLLHAFAHGLRYNPVPSFRWIADAHVVITSSGDALDWDQLVARADRYRLSPWVSAGVAYLDDQFPGLVPPSVVAAARSLPVTPRERRDFEHSTRASAHWIVDTWRRYRRREGDRGVFRAATGFGEELRLHYHLDHVWQVPARAVRGMQQGRRRESNGTGDARAH